MLYVFKSELPFINDISNKEVKIIEAEGEILEDFALVNSDSSQCFYLYQLPDLLLKLFGFSDEKLHQHKAQKEISLNKLATINQNIDELRFSENIARVLDIKSDYEDLLDSIYSIEIDKSGSKDVERLIDIWTKISTYSENARFTAKENRYADKVQQVITLQRELVDIYDREKLVNDIFKELIEQRLSHDANLATLSFNEKVSLLKEDIATIELENIRLNKVVSDIKRQKRDALRKAKQAKEFSQDLKMSFKNKANANLKKYISSQCNMILIQRNKKGKFPLFDIRTSSKKFTSFKNEIIKKGLFSESFYLEKYPDIRQNNVNAFEHYMNVGCYELRNPSAEFNTLQYFMDNPDLLISLDNPLVDYLMKAEND